MLPPGAVHTRELLWTCNARIQQSTHQQRVSSCNSFWCMWRAAAAWKLGLSLHTSYHHTRTPESGQPPARRGDSYRWCVTYAWHSRYHWQLATLACQVAAAATLQQCSAHRFCCSCHFSQPLVCPAPSYVLHLLTKLVPAPLLPPACMLWLQRGEPP